MLYNTKQHTPFTPSCRRVVPPSITGVLLVFSTSKAYIFRLMKRIAPIFLHKKLKHINTYQGQLDVDTETRCSYTFILIVCVKK